MNRQSFNSSKTPPPPNHRDSIARWCFRGFVFLIMIKLAFVILTDSTRGEAGMIPFDSPVGEIGGRGHWYTLRTMKGADYWDDPALTSDVKANQDGTYSISGEAPISVGLVLHPDWFPNEEPWRQAIDWVRQAEQMFRNSGVPVRFLIEHIEVQNDLPDTKESALYAANDTSQYGTDMTIVLLPHYAFDPLCGIAYVGDNNYYGGSIKSVSGCSPKTLAHELGHNFGLRHAHQVGAEGRKGYCFAPASGAKNCTKGTLMSYSGELRVPLFANQFFSYNDQVLGTEEHDAVSWLQAQAAGRALAWELDQRRDVSSSPDYSVEFCAE
jgi:hypothetical protein